MMQVELARLLDVGKVTLGGLIDRLEEHGFVIRTRTNLTGDPSESMCPLPGEPW